MTMRYDLRINQGESFRLTIPVLNDSNNPVTVTGMTARGQIRAWDSSAPALYEWSAANGNLVLSITNVIILVPPAASSAWTFRSAQWDLELVDPATSTTTRLVEGLVIVEPEITV